jgi:hypothetical protein
MKNTIVLTLVSIFAVACAHHRDVRPGVDGINLVVVQTEDSEDGSRNAISQANHYCKEQGRKSAAFITEEKKYTDPEKSGKKINSDPTVNSTAANSYTLEMKFKCQ